MEKLKEDIDRIFKNELYTGYKRNYAPLSGRRSRTSYYTSKVVIDGRELLIKNPTNYELRFPNLHLLIKLFNKIESTESDRKYFINYLNISILSSSKDALFFEVGYLAFETLIKLGFLEEALNGLTVKMINNPISTYGELQILDTIIQYEYPIFSEVELKAIETFADGQIYKNPTYDDVPDHKFQILERINQVFYLRIEKELNEEVNPQINQDKETVKVKISHFGFPQLLSEALDKVDQIYFDQTKDKFDFSNAMKTLRQFWLELMKEIAQRIKNKTEEEYPKSEDTPIANQRVYIKKHLKLDKENKLINGLVDILHGQGGHALISKKEQFRLTRNITIEVALLILSKLEAFELE